jgi:hypothetical protein
MGVWSSYFKFCNLLKYYKSKIKDYLLPYSSHLKKYWKSELINHLRKLRKSYRIVDLLYVPTFIVQL